PMPRLSPFSAWSRSVLVADRRVCRVLCGLPSAESDALDFHAIAVAELKRARCARRRLCREKFPPDPIHFVVMPDIGEDDIDLHDPVEPRRSGFQHMRHVAQGLPDLLGDRAEIASAGDRIHRPHPGKKNIIADANPRRVRQIGTLTFTTLASDDPADSSKCAMLVRIWRVSAATVPCARSPVPGLMAIMPDRKMNSPARMPGE